MKESRSGLWKRPRSHSCCPPGPIRLAQLSAVAVQDLKFPPRGMEAQTNPASWPWFQLMSDALEGRLAGKAPRVTPVWSSEEESIFASSPPADRDTLMGERSSLSELDMVEADADGAVTFIDASGEECSLPSDPAYKSKSLSGLHTKLEKLQLQVAFLVTSVPSVCLSVCLLQCRTRTPGG